MQRRKTLVAPMQPVAIKTGCRLSYVTEEPAPIMLLILPRPENQVIVMQDLITSSGMPVRQHVDSHGNRVLRTTLVPGDNAFRHEAVVVVSAMPDNIVAAACAPDIGRLPPAILRYTFPSRYCESDRIQALAVQQFGHLARGEEQVRAVADWVHGNIEYRHGTGNSWLSACDILHRGYGVCRDFAHVMIAYCRALDIPARYVAGHLPRLPGNETGSPNDMGIDFHAWCEVYLGKTWRAYDARYNMALAGRVKIAHGMDAVDAAFATMYGNVVATHFEAWSMVETGDANMSSGQPSADRMPRSLPLEAVGAN